MEKPKMNIPVCKPDITPEDVEAITECAKSGWVSGISPYTEEFEANFAKFCGSKYAVATNSGSTALQLALAGYGIGRGDEVVVPTFTMVASANAVKFLGAKPVFIDCDPETWNLDPDLLGNVITQKTKAIMPVHIYGHPCALDAIVNLAKIYSESYGTDIKIIDDAAEAFGAKFCGHRIGGAMTDATAFSLYANKTITSGEGGVITCNNEEMWTRLKWLRAQAFGREGRHFWHEEFGYGFRMCGLQAALGNSQLKRGEAYFQARRAHAKKYMEALMPLFLKGKIHFPTQKSYAENSYWMFTILLREAEKRDSAILKLAEAGIETRPVFTPMHQQPIYKKQERKNSYPISDIIGKRGINLPSGNTLTDEEITYVCDNLERILNE